MFMDKQEHFDTISYVSIRCDTMAASGCVKMATILSSLMSPEVTDPVSKLCRVLGQNGIALNELAMVAQFTLVWLLMGVS